MKLADIKAQKQKAVAVIIAKLVEWLRSPTEVHCSNPVIGKMYIEYCFLSTVSKRREKGPIKKAII